MSNHSPEIENCHCISLSDLAVVPMGGDGMDERVFSTIDRVKDHGGDQWWLNLSVCNSCGQHWMIAQDERINDNFYLRRLDVITAEAIRDQSKWPDEFLTYEQVLMLGIKMSTPCVFLDPRSPALVYTANDLRRERPDISVEEIAHLLAISAADAAHLFQRPTVIERFRAWASDR